MTAVAAPTTTVADLAHTRARREPDRLMFTALQQDDAVTVTLTAGELDRQARIVAARLRAFAEPGDRVLVPAMPGLRFQVAFLGCLYARLVAVPIPPIRPGRADADRYTRVISISEDCAPVAAIVPGEVLSGIAAAWAVLPELAPLRLVPAEPVAGPGDDSEPLAHPEPADPAELAVLQYTSGSTAAPRGVMLSHRALVSNQDVVAEHLALTPDTTVVSWLPTYHDMGLCLGVLHPLRTGCPAVVMTPELFVLHPERWLTALSGVPDAVSAAPDFGYAWCVRRIGAAARASLDLAGWRVAINGAEPVRPDTIGAFHATFADCGLRDTTMTPGYGLAEATLFVSGGTGATPPVLRRYARGALAAGRAESVTAEGPVGDAVELVSVGAPGPGTDIAVVDPDSHRALPDRRVGELWVRSPSSGDGYWGQPELSRETFEARLAGTDEVACWLRTGDLGFRDGTEVVVTGRRKDLIVVHGANYYPADFELLATAAHPALDGESAAAIADGDRVVVVVETSRRRDRDGARTAAAAAVRAITAQLPVGTDVVVVPRGQVPRTTSGKPRRQECGRMLAAGALTVLARWPRTTGGAS